MGTFHIKVVNIMVGVLTVLEIYLYKKLITVPKLLFITLVSDFKIWFNSLSKSQALFLAMGKLQNHQKEPQNIDLKVSRSIT